MSNIHKKINARATAVNWAKITIKELQESIDKKKIGVSGKLRQSFYYINKIDPIKFSGSIEIRYEAYGAMVDMGVGRGVKIEDVRENATSRLLEGRQTGNRRRPKRWKSKVAARQAYRFNEIMTEKAGRLVLAGLKDEINGNKRGR